MEGLTSRPIHAWWTNTDVIGFLLGLQLKVKELRRVILLVLQIVICFTCNPCPIHIFLFEHIIILLYLRLLSSIETLICVCFLNFRHQQYFAVRGLHGPKFFIWHENILHSLIHGIEFFRELPPVGLLKINDAEIVFFCHLLKLLPEQDLICFLVHGVNIFVIAHEGLDKFEIFVAINHFSEGAAAAPTFDKASHILLLLLLLVPFRF